MKPHTSTRNLEKKFFDKEIEINIDDAYEMKKSGTTKHQDLINLKKIKFPKKFQINYNSTENSSSQKSHRDKTMSKTDMPLVEVLKEKNETENEEVRLGLLNFNFFNKNSSTMKKNPQIPYDYLSDIFENMHNEEIKMRIHSHLFEKQKEISGKMRAIVLNWIMEVHLKFKLFQETLFLCVNLFDRFISEKPINRNRLQLLAVTCLLVACKYEEIFSPEIRDFVFILDKSFYKEDIVLMERELMKVIKFEITGPSSLKFFEILTVVFNITQNETFLGFYMLETFLLNYKCNKFEPSLVASTVCYIVLKHYDKYSAKFYDVINYKEDQIKSCAFELCYVLDNIRDSEYKSVFKKYSTKQYQEVSLKNLRI